MFFLEKNGIRGGWHGSSPDKGIMKVGLFIFHSIEEFFCSNLMCAVRLRDGMFNLYNLCHHLISTPSITLKKKLEIYIELQIRFVSFKILNLAEEVAASRVKLGDTHILPFKRKRKIQFSKWGF